jgi:ASC-1-like (ASCH) protein
MKYTEFTGKTVDDAVEKGLKELGLTAEQADIRVLEEGKRKLFGSIKARVEIAAKEEAVEETVEEIEAEEVQPKALANFCPSNASDGERTVTFLEGLFELLHITACTELVSEKRRMITRGDGIVFMRRTVKKKNVINKYIVTRFGNLKLLSSNFNLNISSHSLTTDEYCPPVSGTNATPSVFKFKSLQPTA